MDPTPTVLCVPDQILVCRYVLLRWVRYCTAFVVSENKTTVSDQGQTEVYVFVVLDLAAAPATPTTPAGIVGTEKQTKPRR